LRRFLIRGSLVACASALFFSSCVHSSVVKQNKTALVQKYDHAEVLKNLQEGATSEDPTLRAIALSGLVSVEPSGGWLARALFDPSDWVKRMTVQALDFDQLNENQIAQLIALTSRANVEASTRGWVADRLTRSGHNVPALEPGGDSWEKIHLSLPFASVDPVSHRLVEEALSRGRVGFHPEVLVRIGHTEDKTYLKSLREGTFVVEPEMEVSYLAARAWLGDAEVHDRMVALIEEDPEHAISLLMVSLPPETLEVVVHAAKKVRYGAVQCLVYGVGKRNQQPPITTSPAARALCASNASAHTVSKWSTDNSLVVQIAALRRSWALSVVVPVGVLIEAEGGDYPLLRMLASRALASQEEKN
jgi:hypothetical protein